MELIHCAKRIDYVMKSNFMPHHDTVSPRILGDNFLFLACCSGDCDIDDIGRACILGRFSSHSLIQNALVNNDDALVNVIKQSLNLKFVKSKKVS